MGARKMRRNGTKQDVAKQAGSMGVGFEVWGTGYDWDALQVVLDRLGETGRVDTKQIPVGLRIEKDGNGDPLVTDHSVATFVPSHGVAGTVYYVDEDEELDELTGFHASSLKRALKGGEPHDRHVFIADYLLTGDYTGAADIARANIRAIENMLEEEEVDLEGHAFEITGPHGMEAMAFRLDSTHPVVLDVLSRLDSYPLLDEQEHSELERELQEEAWENWARSDFVQGIEKRLGIEIDDEDDDVRTVFFEAQDQVGDDGHAESGGWYFPMERYIEQVDRDDLDDADVVYTVD